MKYIDKLQAITKTPLSEGTILGKRALAYISYVPKASLDSAYNMLSKSVNMTKGESEYIITQQFMKISAQKYKANKAHGEQIVQDYLDASTYVVDVLDKYNKFIETYTEKFKETNDPKDSIRADGYGKMIDAARIARSNIDAYFINSGAASCQDLDTIYAPKIEENKENIEYLNKVINVMSMLKCTDQDAYLTASEYALAINPTAKAAMGVGFRYFKKGETDKAMELFDQAISLETSVTNKAEMCYKAAVVNYSLKKYAKAREYAQQAIELNSKYGMPYILIAQCYAAAPNWHSDATMNKCTFFLVLDKLNRAKAVDPSVAKEAQKFINSYSTHTPAADDLFMKGYNKGQAITIGGWINERTTIR
jgi:tetratricopeptide (TPR) repeat protein